MFLANLLPTMLSGMQLIVHPCLPPAPSQCQLLEDRILPTLFTVKFPATGTMVTCKRYSINTRRMTNGRQSSKDEGALCASHLLQSQTLTALSPFNLNLPTLHCHCPSLQCPFPSGVHSCPFSDLLSLQSQVNFSTASLIIKNIGITWKGID